MRNASGMSSVSVWCRSAVETTTSASRVSVPASVVICTPRARALPAFVGSVRMRETGDPVRISTPSARATRSMASITVMRPPCG
ncbi:hypothetical protein BC477_06325 [Clavibacter michiganensis subsp. michiganensis]|uniref:Uncharacterized protein n=1 Tax=Clavibacter michiganensis subsp. michiganensis TaxID=33013 RepID=A0A251XM98_CLAMM|nr:hypothetical protein BC477_06325 [Clavibacter michiganensis subsp. michiganensis]OUE04333.1 hypothetical protein CMMCAS07_05255 [Clavibacter michiganensis subsp. michiganensis]